MIRGILRALRAALDLMVVVALSPFRALSDADAALYAGDDPGEDVDLRACAACGNPVASGRLCGGPECGRDLPGLDDEPTVALPGQPSWWRDGGPELSPQELEAFAVSRCLDHGAELCPRCVVALASMDDPHLIPPGTYGALCSDPGGHDFNDGQCFYCLAIDAGQLDRYGEHGQGGA